MAQVTTLQRRKGDTYPIAITVTDSSGNALDITGNTYVLYVTAENDPSDETYQLTLVGTLTDAPNGKVEFPLTTGEADTILDSYFVIKQTAGTEITSILEGPFKIEWPDILIKGTNSYGSLAEADVYFNLSIRSGNWDLFDALKKQQALVEATRILDRMPWLGEKESEAQALQFGRTGLTYNGKAIDAAESLLIAMDAQFEYAYALLTDPKILNAADASGSNLKSAKAGSARVEFFRATKGGRLPTAVNDIIGEFKNGSTGGVGLVSGNCDETAFESGQYNKSRGFY